MKYKLRFSGQFRRAYKLCKRRGYELSKLEKVISILVEKGRLPQEYQPHILSGKLAGIWECHITSDWLLLWEQNNTDLILLMLDTGTHSDVF